MPSNISFISVNTTIENQYKKGNLLKNVLRLALPISLQSMLSASFHLVDTAMVVQLGDVQTAALGACSRWFFMVNLTFFGFASGMSVLVSQYWGVNDTKNIRKSFGLGLINVAAIGTILTLLLFFFTSSMLNVFTNEQEVIAKGVEYMKIACWTFVPLSVAYIFSYLLRSTEIVILPLIITVISAVLNTFLNYVLIFGHFGFPAMGIKGAATATLTSAIVQMVLIISISYIKKNVAAAKIKELFSVSRDFIKKYYILALPVLANEVLWALGVNVYNMVFGRQGTANYAAFTIYSSIEQVMFTFFVGVCSACAVIVGKMVGRGDFRQAYETAKKFIIYSLIFAVGMGIIVIVVRNPIISLLNVESANTAAIVSRLLFIYAFTIPLFVLPYITIVGIFRSGGDTRTGLIYDMLNVWLIGVPAVALAGLVFKLPFEWVFTMMFTEHIVKSIMCLRYFKSKKWIRRVTEPELLDVLEV